MTYTAVYTHEMGKVGIVNENGVEIVVSSRFGIPNIGDQKTKIEITSPETVDFLDKLFRANQIPNEIDTIKKEIIARERRIDSLKSEYGKITSPVFKPGEYDEKNDPIPITFKDIYMRDIVAPVAVVCKRIENENRKIELHWIDIKGKFHIFTSNFSREEVNAADSAAYEHAWE